MKIVLDNYIDPALLIGSLLVGLILVCGQLILNPSMLFIWFMLAMCRLIIDSLFEYYEDSRKI